MKITELIVESKTQQLDELSAADIGRGVGKVAKGIGAVAGGVRGAYDVAKQGFQTGRDVVSGKKPAAAPADAAADDEQEPATTAQDINAQGPKGTAPAKSQTGAAAQAIQKTAQATQGANPDQAGQTVYAQVKSQINNLDKKGKQRILQLLQKSLAAPAAAPQQSMADKVTAAQTQAAPAAPQAAAEKKPVRGKKKVAPSQAEINADRERLIPATGESIEQRLNKRLAESVKKYSN